MECLYFALELLRSAEAGGQFSSHVQAANFLNGLIAGTSETERAISLIKNEEFRAKVENSKGFCLQHFEQLLKAIDHIDEVIELIKKSKSIPDAKIALMERFDLDDAQAQAIVDMKLGQLAGLERDKIEAEYKELTEKIADLEDITVACSNEDEYEASPFTTEDAEETAQEITVAKKEETDEDFTKGE